MMKSFRRTIVAFAAVALTSTTLHAQFQSEIRNVAKAGVFWSFDLLFRNTQTSAPIGTVNPIWSITGFQITIPTMLAKCGFSCEISAFNLRSVGSVDTRRLGVEGAQWISAPLGWSGDEFCAVRCTSHPVYTDGINVGILGCQLPLTNPTNIWFYTARTCDEEGFSGWMAWTVFVNFGANVSDFSADDVVISPTIRQIGTVTAAIAPEPEVGQFLLAGFALLFGIQRLRHRRRSQVEV